MKRIATRRPYDDPKVERVYYRLVAYPATIVDKTHQPYAFNGKKLKRIRDLFIPAELTKWMLYPAINQKYRLIL